MPFRARLKKTFSRSSSTSSPPREDSTSTDRSSSLYYQPGEKIPYKYRRPVEKAHKEKLEGFSWASAWRRKSHQSQYSPHGSRMPSRAGSAIAAPAGFRLGSLDGGVRGGSIDSRRKPSRLSDELPPDEVPTMHKPLEPIHSSQAESPKDDTGNPFSPDDLNDAIRKARISS